MRSQLSNKTLEADRLERQLQLEKERALNLEKAIIQLKDELLQVNQQLHRQSDEAKSLAQKLSDKEKILKKLESTGQASSLEAENLREECDGLRGEIEGKIQEIDLLKNQLSTLRSDYQSLEETADQAQSSNKQLRQEIVELGQALELTKSQAMEQQLRLELTIKKQEEIVADLKSRVQSVSEKLEQHQSQALITSQRLSEIEAELETANRDIGKNKDSILLLTEERNSLVSQLKDSQSQVTQLSDTIRDLTLKNQKLSAKLNKKSEEYNELEASLRSMRSQLSNKTLEAEKLNILLNFEQRKIEKLTHYLLVAKKEIVELKLAIDDLSYQLETAARKLHLAEETTGGIRSELIALHSELEINQDRQREISMALLRSKGQNRSLTSELEDLKAQHNNLRDRQEGLLLTLASTERENGILRNHIRYLQEQNNLLSEDNKQLLDENDELRGELNVQRFTVQRLTEESDQLGRIVSDKEFEIFGLKSSIAQRDHQIQELERRCRVLQQGFSEQLAQSVSIHDFEMLEDELAANKRILALANDHVTGLEAENAQLRALLASGGSLPQETGMSNARSQPSGEKAPTKPRSWVETYRNLLGEEVTVKKIHSLELDEADDTTSAYEEGYTTAESEFDQDASGGNRGRDHYDDDTGPHSSSSLLRGDLPVIKSSAIIAYPRTIEDVHRDINQEIGATNVHYTTGIIGTKPTTAATPDTRYVRLASVNPAAPNNPARKLLDADLDNVTVYRRFTESSISPTTKAKVILSSMGIPPDKSKGFELPTELVINGSSDPDDPIFKEDGRNNNAVAIIQEMFKIYNDYVEKEELDASSGPSTPRNTS